MQCFRCMEQLPTNFNIHYKLPLIVGAIGHTVLLLDPWDAPATIKRI